MVPPLCYKHNDIHSKLINALHFSRALKNNFPAPAGTPGWIRRLYAPAGRWEMHKEPGRVDLRQQGDADAGTSWQKDALPLQRRCV